jgi:Proteasome subunit
MVINFCVILQIMCQVDPSGSYFSWKASAMGKNVSNAKTFLEKRYISVAFGSFYIIYLSVSLDNSFYLLLTEMEQKPGYFILRFPTSITLVHFCAV